MRLLEIADLAAERGGRPLLQGVQFTLQAGEALLLRGPNGSGKSTLLRALLGLIPTRSGTVCIDGAPPLPLGERALAPHTLFLGHAGGVKAELSALENLEIAGALDGSVALPAPPPDRQRLLAALERCGLAHRKHVEARRLSQGQRQRLTLARLVLARELLPPGPARPLWLLDEPTAALDQAGDGWFGSILSEHLQHGGLAVIATHLPLALAASGAIRHLELEGP